jgi:YbgC/YbaW family acyl-CoA thioester hydrolase
VRRFLTIFEPQKLDSTLKLTFNIFMYKSQHVVRMYDTDTAQILFFGNQFRFINDALEDLLASIGLNMNILFTEKKYGFVVRHAESDYLAPSRVGDHLKIETTVSHIGNTSFTFEYKIFNETSTTLVGTGKTTHVVIDNKNGKKQAIPEELKQALKSV